MRGRGRLANSSGRRAEEQRAGKNQGEAKQLRTTLPQRRSGKLAYVTPPPETLYASDSKDTPYYGAEFTLSSRISKTTFSVGRAWRQRRKRTRSPAGGQATVKELSLDQLEDAPCRNRTCNLMIKSHLLCQLS